MFINCRLKKATQITVQRKAFRKQIIPESSCVREKIVDINILTTSRNGDKN